ncbi:MAG: glycoside hydrolase family 28 protein [Saprospiraceae bacterium]|nr:glycoside hydrolase family 28 protein [Saprospiraceae bacterium]
MCCVTYSTVHAQNKIYDITNFGATSNIESLQTEYIQAAIDAASKDGGGKVLIPKGTFVSGSIVLKSNLDLHLEEGAMLLGSLDPRDYFKLGYSMAFILAENQQDISISGSGEVNGRGRRVALNADSLHHSGIDVDQSYNYRRMRPNKRPKLMQLAHCRGVNIEGVTFRNGANWVLSFERCEDLIIENVIVDSDAYWNNDGIDVSDSKNVRITGCDVNTADDGICLKSHSAGFLNENIYIGNCKVRSSASAIKFGTASLGGFRNVTVENIKVYDTFRSAIALESVDGGILEDVKVQNIEAVNTGNAFFIRLGHRNVDGQVGSLKNVSIKNMRVQIPFDRPDAAYDLRGPELPFFHNPFPASIAGLPGHNVQNVTLENISVTYPGRSNNGLAYKSIYFLDNIPENESAYPEFHMFGELPAWAMFVRHVDGLKMKNVSFTLEDPDFRSGFVFDDVKNLKFEGVELDAKGGDKALVLRNVKEATFRNIRTGKELINRLTCIEGCKDVSIEKE